MNILLVNLTRFGDLLQSQAAISALAAKVAAASGRPGQPGPAGPANRSGAPGQPGPFSPPSPPGHSGDFSGNQPGGLSGGLGLVCLANFAFSAGFLRGLDHTFPLPRDAFLPGLDRPAAAQPDLAQGADSGEAWLEALAGLWRWREEIWSRCKPDLVCNLTPTVPARLLAAYLADGAPLAGFGLDESGFASDNPWATFLRSATRARFASPFNIIDLFRAVSGTGQGQPGDAALQARTPAEVAGSAARLKAALTPEMSGLRGFVAFQLGASENRRRWPLEYFAALGRGLWQAGGWLPLLLGSKGELDLARRYAELNARAASESGRGQAAGGDAPFISLVGETSLEELAGVLENCALLVSNDTGTLHLAAGLGRPCLGLFLATAQPWDTGPGLPGCLSLEPDLPCHPCAFGQACPHDLRCRRAISAELVLKLALTYLENGCWPEIAAKAGARAWLTEKDQEGMLDLRSLSGHDADPRSRWMRVQRWFLSQFLDRDPAVPFQLQSVAPGGKSHEIGQTERAALLAELQGLAGQLELLLTQGQVLLVRPLPQFRERFLQNVQRLSQTFESSQFFPALGLVWRAEVEEHGGDLNSALACAAQYQSLINGLYQAFTPA